MERNDTFKSKRRGVRLTKNRITCFALLTWVVLLMIIRCVG